VEKKDPEKNAEDRGEEGENREPADRIFVDQFEPDKIGDKGNDDGLIEERTNDIRINLVNPLRFEDDAHDEQDGNREEKLIKKGVYRLNLFCHKLLDIKRCSSPQDSGSDLQNISKVHSCFGRFRSAAKDAEDAGEGQDEA